jgi:hypothetical protein
MTFLGKTTWGVGNPLLHRGGWQVAIIVALPAFTNEAVPMSVPPAVNAPASEELHVRVGVICVFEESYTVAVIVLLPVDSIKEVRFEVESPTARVIDTTGQVVN